MDHLTTADTVSMTADTPTEALPLSTPTQPKRRRFFGRRLRTPLTHAELRQQCQTYMQPGETIPQAMARLSQHLTVACTKLLNDKRDAGDQRDQREALTKTLQTLRAECQTYLQTGEGPGQALARLTAEVDTLRTDVARLTVERDYAERLFRSALGGQS